MANRKLSVVLTSAYPSITHQARIVRNGTLCIKPRRWHETADFVRELAREIDGAVVMEFRTDLAILLIILSKRKLQAQRLRSSTIDNEYHIDQGEAISSRRFGEISFDESSTLN